MSSVARVFDGCSIFEGQPITIRAEVVDSLTNVALTTIDVSSWSLKVYDRSGRGALVYEIEGQSPALIMLDVPLSWGAQDGGYNVQLQILGDAFEQVGGHVYLVELTLTLVSGAKEPIPVSVAVTSIQNA